MEADLGTLTAHNVVVIHPDGTQTSIGTVPFIRIGPTALEAIKKWEHRQLLYKDYVAALALYKGSQNNA